MIIHGNIYLRPAMVALLFRKSRPMRMKKYITFVVMYDSYKGLTAANGAKYFSKKENYTVNCSLKEFYITFITAWDGRNGNGNIVFNHDKSKNNQTKVEFKLIQEVLRKHYFQMLAMIQVQKKLLIKFKQKKLVFFKLLSH